MKYALKMTLFLLSVVLILASTSLAQRVVVPQLQPTPAEIVAVARCLADKNCAPWLSWKTYGENKGAQAAFEHDGKRYTIYAPFQTEKVSDIVDKLGGYVTFWIRPKGSTSQKQVETFTANLAGVVYSGNDASSQHDMDLDAKPPRGVQNRELWQQKFDKAFAVTVAYLDAHSKTWRQQR